MKSNVFLVYITAYLMAIFFLLSMAALIKGLDTKAIACALLCMVLMKSLRDF